MIFGWGPSITDLPPDEPKWKYGPSLEELQRLTRRSELLDRAEEFLEVAERALGDKPAIRKMISDFLVTIAATKEVK